MIKIKNLIKENNKENHFNYSKINIFSSDNRSVGFGKFYLYNYEAINAWWK